MDGCTGSRDITEIMLKTAFNTIQSINPFPDKPWFLHVYSKSHLKTWLEKEKLLVTSNFSFSQSVFNPFGELSAIFITFKIVTCNSFHLEESNICHLGKGKRTIFPLHYIDSPPINYLCKPSIK